jgi:hypothetical protein
VQTVNGIEEAGDDVVDAQAVGKTTVLRGRIDQIAETQLMNPPKTLQQGRIEKSCRLRINGNHSPDVVFDYPSFIQVTLLHSAYAVVDIRFSEPYAIERSVQRRRDGRGPC